MAKPEPADNPAPDADTVHYDGPAGGWGSLRGIARHLRQGVADARRRSRRSPRQNKPHGFMCVSCSWAKPADHHPFEFCENGAKATLWELTTRRCTPDVFRRPHGQRAPRHGGTTISSSRAA